MRRFALTLLLSTLAATSSAQDYHAEKVIEGLSIPWAIEFVSPTEMVINEKNGTISLLNIETNQRQPLYSINDVYQSGQGGLLDIAHLSNPDGSHTLYFSYSKSTPDGVTLAVAQAELRGNQLEEFNDIFVANAYSNTSRHFGSRIEVAKQYLYITIGDRGERENGQDLQTHAGTIVRLNLDGTIPDGNPFVAKPGLDEIWSYGHRNPQGLFYDHKEQQLWSIEHGPRGGDEINLIERGNNYGWPKASHGKEYWGPLDVGEAESLPGMEDPLLVYVPSIAPSNMILYRGEAYPDLDGKLLAGALKLAHINVVSITDTGLVESQRLLEDLGERIRDIAQSPGGEVYFSADSGTIYRLKVE
ncbi:PQQ-dependent sugar dehydrogenase [Vibrio sp. WXL210]|uniref:PQQ-dependent sugar dehydrogenase n=1 Tax=Vibrio sp. WXL210 TaxID=3450709 RepID=UPI003EC72161